MRPTLEALLERAAELKAGRERRARVRGARRRDRRAVLRDALDADPRLVPGRRRRARRPPAAAARRRAPARARRVDRRHGPRPLALPARDRDPLGLPRDRRRARGRRVGRAGGQRADAASPSVPGARRPAHPARALRRARRASSSPTSATATTSPARSRSSAGSAGVEVRVATPPGYELEPGLAALDTHDPREAAAGADALYTDVWVSMGDEPDADRAARRPAAPISSTRTCSQLGVRPRDLHCTASRRTRARRSPRRPSTGSARRSGTRPRTASTHRRRCSSC